MLALVPATAQEVLLPLQFGKPLVRKWAGELTLPFFDDFSDTVLSGRQWLFGGAFVNQGYAPLPPTVGMVTLDAFDEEGRLYPNTTNQFFGGDTLTSQPIRLDSAFAPYARRLGVGDSLYLSFFYIPGGGYGNRWERVGDIPERGDSLVLEFHVQGDTAWRHVWSMSGEEADSLYARTGNYWQYVEVPILDVELLSRGFQFRFRNYCSLDSDTKKGLLSNADQWNIDYVRLAADRCKGDSVSRDLAFVNPAPSMLRRYQSMPANQYLPSEMKDTLEMTITNLFSEELAYSYGFRIESESGREEYSYEGGYENAPVFWREKQYQTSHAHARPALSYAFPSGMTIPTTYTIVHGVSEGVSSDAYSSNDTVRFSQVFDNYYAYDDGSPENGYGVTSTSSRVKLACRFRLNVEDTLTAVKLYFNRTLNNENESVRFYLTIWDDAEGEPGSIIYQDAIRRKPEFAGFNEYVRYDLEEPLVCGGTIYVGLEQATNDYINLGFDRNHDASDDIFYLTSASWQKTILTGALMLRPCFGTKRNLGLDHPGGEGLQSRVWVKERRIVVEGCTNSMLSVYDMTGRVVYSSRGGERGIVVTSVLPVGVYVVRAGSGKATKVVVL